MANSAKERQNYSYTRIADLKSGIYNVLGVVKFSKIPVRSRGPDLVQVLSITDETVTEKLVVTLFYSAAEYFPAASVGDVIRLHRLRVETIGGELKGRPGPGFSWLLVHDDVDSPTVSSKTYTYADHTKQRVRELQKWAGEQSWMRQASQMTSLCDLVPSQYFDLVCQVVGTVTERQGVCFVARVWDGTTCRYGVACIEEMVDVDPALEEQAGNLTVDVWIYDDHVASCQNIKPGQFIKLCNLHAALHKEDDTRASDELPVLELVLHRGTAYGRGVVALNQQSPLVAVVKQRMDRCLSGEAVHEASEATPEQACSSAENPADQLAQNQNDPAQTAARPVVCSKDQAQKATSEPGAATSGHHRRESESPQPGGCHRVQDDPQGHRQKGRRDHRKRKHGGGDHQNEEEDPQECCQRDGRRKGQYENEDKRRPVQSAQQQPVCGSVSSTTSGTEKTGPSVTCTQVCSRLGDEDNPVVISSSSVEREHDPAGNSTADRETGATADAQGLVGVSNHRTVGCGEAESSGGGVGAGGKGGNFIGDTSCEDNELSQVLLSSESGSGNKEMLQPSQQSSTENCMLQTASVITGHHHINRTPISDVVRHAVPSKFRVLAHLVDVYPDPSDPWQLVKQLCPKCFFLTTPQRETVSSTSETGAASATQQSVLKSATTSITSKLAGLLGGRFANWNPDILETPEQDVMELCPQCKTGGERVPLELIYMLRLMLRDSKGDCLVANLWRDNAVTFFRGVSPELAMHTEGRMEELAQSLRSLCVDHLDGPEPPSSLPPRLDCCLLSYTAGGNLNFHIFDTVLV